MRWMVVAALAAALGTGTPAGAVEHYGQQITVTDVTQISQILKAPESYVGKEVLVEGMVVAVCAKRGCWLELASDREFEKIRIKVKDGVIVFPMSARGQVARVQGVVEEIRMTQEQALAWKRHQAEERGESFDPSSVAGPVTYHQIRALGAEIQ